MVLVPGDPVVGGTTLRRDAITSPAFNLANPAASPTPSWGILQNGLAYFFGLILSGGTIEGPDYIINTSGAFFYSGTPALGNLIASIAATAGVDSFGNAYVAGVAAYVKIASGTGAGTYAVALADQAAPYGNNAALSIQNLTNPASIPPAFVVNIDTTDGNVTELHSGKKTAAAIQSSLQLNDSIFTGLCSAALNADIVQVEPVANTAAEFEINGYLQLDALTSAPAGSINGPRLYGATSQPACVNPQGLGLFLSGAQGADNTNFTVTSSTFAQCSKAWPIPANDASAGTIYRLTVAGDGTQGSTQEVLGFETSGGFAAANISQTFQAASTAFSWKVIIEIEVITTGAGGTANYSLWCTAGAGVNNGFSHAGAFNTTVANTLEAQAKWGAITGAPTMTSRHSYFERIGP